jgi:hypothetical protein
VEGKFRQDFLRSNGGQRPAQGLKPATFWGRYGTALSRALPQTLPDDAAGGCPIQSRFLRLSGCGGQFPFLAQCNTCFPSRCAVTAHTDAPDHFLRV